MKKDRRPNRGPAVPAVERQLISEGTCSIERWKPWYLDHPLVSHFATRLIWEFEEGGETRTAIPWRRKAIWWIGRAILSELSQQARVPDVKASDPL